MGKLRFLCFHVLTFKSITLVFGLQERPDRCTSFMMLKTFHTLRCTNISTRLAENVDHRIVRSLNAYSAQSVNASFPFQFIFLFKSIKAKKKRVFLMFFLSTVFSLFLSRFNTPTFQTLTRERRILFHINNKNYLISRCGKK